MLHCHNEADQSVFGNLLRLGGSCLGCPAIFWWAVQRDVLPDITLADLSMANIRALEASAWVAGMAGWRNG